MQALALAAIKLPVLTSKTPLPGGAIEPAARVHLHAESGMSDPEMLEIIERERGRALPTSYAERVELLIEAEFRQSLAPIKGVAEALDSLTLPICVASSSSLEQIRQKLKITGLLECFNEHLFSATMVARGKPAPDLFLYAAQQLTTAPDRCLVIEDSPAGIDAALAAGMTAIGFSGGSHCGRSTVLVYKSTERRWSLTTSTNWRPR